MTDIERIVIEKFCLDTYPFNKLSKNSIEIEKIIETHYEDFIKAWEDHFEN
ncbi:MAG: hypothetical protein KAU26_02970 [Methylococcales bacterium]|nr:hypothetical protein [Methylococcales bacterium]